VLLFHRDGTGRREGKVTVNEWKGRPGKKNGRKEGGRGDGDGDGEKSQISSAGWKKEKRSWAELKPLAAATLAAAAATLAAADNASTAGMTPADGRVRRGMADCN
jgi:hypothetical protein